MHFVYFMHERDSKLGSCIYKLGHTKELKERTSRLSGELQANMVPLAVRTFQTKDEAVAFERMLQKKFWGFRLGPGHAYQDERFNFEGRNNSVQTISELIGTKLIEKQKVIIFHESQSEEPIKKRYGEAPHFGDLSFWRFSSLVEYDNFDIFKYRKSMGSYRFELELLTEWFMGNASGIRNELEMFPPPPIQDSNIPEAFIHYKERMGRRNAMVIAQRAERAGQLLLEAQKEADLMLKAVWAHQNGLCPDAVIPPQSPFIARLA